jgi:hypothetical protein
MMFIVESRSPPTGKFSMEFLNTARDNACINSLKNKYITGFEWPNTIFYIYF